MKQKGMKVISMDFDVDKGSYKRKLYKWSSINMVVGLCDPINKNWSILWKKTDDIRS